MTTITKPVRLIITRDTWESALRPLLVGSGRCAVGPTSWRGEAACTEILCHQLASTAKLPQGAGRPPFDDWLVLALGHEPAIDWVVQIAPRDSQRLTVLVLDPVDRGTWNGAVSDRGRIAIVSEIQVVGPHGLKIDGTSDQSVDSVDATLSERASRTIGALGSDVAAKVRRATVTVVGASRLGSRVAFQLAGLGVGGLRLIDGKTLRLDHLDAACGFTESDVGLAKAEALARRLIAYRSDLLVSFVPKSLPDAEAMGLLRRRSDLYVTAVDSDAARLSVSAITKKELLAVHLDVGTYIPAAGTMHADVRLLLGNSAGGCVACVGGVTDLERALYEIATPPGALARGEPVAWDEQRSGSAGTINSIAAGVAVQSWIALLAGRLTTSYWYRIRWRDGELQIDSGPVASDPNCRFCR